MTVDDLLVLPADRWRFELIDGHLLRREPGDLRYGTIESALLLAVRDAARTGAIEGVTLSETGFVLSAAGEPDTVLAPALAFVRTDHMPTDEIPHTGSAVRRIPDLVAEIAAPSQSSKAMGERAQRWLTAGTRVVWVVWPARRRVDVWRRREGDEPEVSAYSIHEMLRETEALPDFAYPIASLFI
jgi:Uma2 family endonuclease